MIAAITWDPPLSLFSFVGWDGLRYYTFLWFAGLALAYWIVKYLYEDQKIPSKAFDPLLFYCFIGILAGARLGHCLFYEPAYYLHHPLEMILPIKFTDSGIKLIGFHGLASHGGTVGLMIALWLYVRRTKLNLWTVLDNIAIATPITACCIRIGNFMNSEIIGKPTGSDWGVIFAQVDNLPRHPAQLYEAIAYLIFFVIGILLYRKYRTSLGKGFYFGYCLTTIFTFRFFVEFLKERQVSFEDSMALDMGQWLSIPFILLGLFCLLRNLIFYMQKQRVVKL